MSCVESTLNNGVTLLFFSYLLNPYTIGSCVAHSTGVFTDLGIVLALYTALRGVCVCVCVCVHVCVLIYDGCLQCHQQDKHVNVFLSLHTLYSTEFGFPMVPQIDKVVEFVCAVVIV